MDYFATFATDFMKISEEFDTAVAFAREEAMRTGCTQIGADHLMLGLLRLGSESVSSFLAENGINPAELKAAIEKKVFRPHGIPYGLEDDIRLGEDGNSAINLAIAAAQMEGASEAGVEHLVRALGGITGSECSRILREAGLRVSAAKHAAETKEYTPSEDEINRLLGAFRYNSEYPS